MKNGWRKVKLGEVASFVTGKLDSNAAVQDGKYPFFTCSQETYRTNTYSFDTECVLLAGNNANGIYPLKYFSGKFDVYQRTYIIRSVNKNVLMNRYLFYALRLKLELLRSISTGAATKFLTMGLLNSLEVELPNIDNQKSITSILSAYDNLIENNTRRIKILEEMARLIYREWFVEFRAPGIKLRKATPEEKKVTGKDVFPVGWEVRELGEFIELGYGKGLKAELRIEGTIPVYGSGGIVGNHNEAIVRGPGIVVGRKGNFGSVYWSEVDFFPIDTVFYVRSKTSLHYVYYCLLNQTFINTDAAVPGLNRESALRKNGILPDNAILNRFQSIIENIFKNREFFNRTNTNLCQTRDMLLPKLISGEVEV